MEKEIMDKCFTFYIQVVIGFACLLSCLAVVEAQTVVRGPYLQQGTSNSMIIKWRTDIATDSVVDYGLTANDLNQSVTDFSLDTEHEVQISSLTPHTQYYYAIGDSTSVLGGDNSFVFRTSPTPGTAEPTRIWVIGDSGTADANARAVRDAFKNYTGSTETHLWLMLGDNAYNDGTDSEYQASVFNTYPELLQQIPLWSTLGNHDGHSADSAFQTGPYYDIFTLPKNAEAGGVMSGTEAYYSFEYGNIHFVVLDSYDSNRTPGGAMLTWLHNDLAVNQKEWVIAFWHHPPYTKGSHNSDSESQLIDMRSNALPILEDYGVDLVLTGHSHSYERSFLIDGHYGFSSEFNPSQHTVDGGDGRVEGDGAYSKTGGIGATHSGAVYMVAGCSGKATGGSLDHPVMFLSLNSLGSIVLNVNGNQLDVEFLDSNVPPNGPNVLDHFTISKGSDVIPPTIDEVQAIDASTIIVDFSEPIDQFSAENANNYSVDYGITINNATLQANSTTVHLNTSPLSQNVTYTLIVNGIADLASNPIATNSQSQFSYDPQSTREFQDGNLPDASYTGTSDSYIFENEPNNNFGNDADLRIDGNDPSGTNNDVTTLISWDITSIPAGSTVLSASVTFQVFNYSNSSYELYQTLRSWNETQTTWNQAENGNSWQVAGAQGAIDRGTTVLGSIIATSSGSYTIPLNTTGLTVIQDWINGVYPNNGFVISNSNSSDGLDVRSREYSNAAQRPKLTIVYSPDAIDIDPPTPDPMTWVVAPYSTGANSISMTASTASDPSGVEYYFACTSGSGNDSGWQDSPTYTDTSLLPDTSYTYTVTARDKSTNQNITTASAAGSATTDTLLDTSPPTPNPMTWVVAPNSTGVNSISMTASTASDPSGVEYYFTCTVGGGNDSGWQDSPTYTDTGLQPDTSYTYTVTARDKSTNQNATTVSEAASATTDALPDTSPPTPDPMTWATVPYPTGANSISMTASTASDPSGVEYYFACTAGGSNDSGWQDSPTYTDTSLLPNTSYTYTVTARDKSLSQNTSTTSTANTATTYNAHVTFEFQNGNLPDASYSGTNDSYIFENGPDTNFGNNADLRIDGDDPSATNNDVTTLISWDISSIPAGSTVLSASITFQVFNYSNNSYELYQTLLDWDEYQSTWNQAETGNSWQIAGAQGAVDRSAIELGSIIATSNGSYTIPLNTAGLAVIQDWINGASPNYGFVIANSISSDGIDIRSSEYSNSAQRPRLTIVYSPDTTDNEPPTPDPITWAEVPHSTGTNSISMTASTASDPSGVEYYFTCIAGGGNDSSWQDSPIYNDTGLQPNTSYTYTIAARDKSANQNISGSSNEASATTESIVSNLKLDIGIVNTLASSWATVNLSHSYDSMVVVATLNYDSSSAPAVVRIQNASGSSFDVRIDPAGGVAPSNVNVYYMVVEEGIYTESVDGVKMEAVKFLSTVTDDNNSWIGQNQDYSNSYTNPVVLGQVMSYNDSGFSSFWCNNGTSRSTPPSATAISVGKTVSEDIDTTRADETLGYIVLESGAGTIDNVNYVAALGTDTIKGIGDSPSYDYSISGPSSASLAIATLSAMDGGNGGWAVLYGSNPVSSNTLRLAIDEDVAADTERNHTTEQVAYIVFESEIIPDTDPPTPDPATFSIEPVAISDTAITMTATTGTDPSGPVEYYFDEISGNIGGIDSGWVTDPVYTNTGLIPSTQYTYSVQMRDSISNIGAQSSFQSATTETVSSWTELTNDDFETGFGNYTDGGGDCSLYTGSTYAHQGSNAANIQDNSGTASSFSYTIDTDVDTPGYTQIEIDFWFKAISMDNTNEDFWIQYFDGLNWHTVATYAKGTDFDNDVFYHEKIYIDELNYIFPTNMKIRFMCDASGNRDDVYIDEIKISAK
ncbi:MAG: DNRLRE domain-containing protein [Candidatus Brocadiaceae bacterium]|nr:DNRLRE domain-containing protein [Candidatus Brocadiaceae bacterium]